ncbi:enoyl-CoA hydratase [Bacillus salitolerans]|uniref:Enoyl-CoA hydratase n=1 Tax=Bacillus salitolerans TaxID=1437434 RepID=A0ABW4LX23_9BACI
MSNTILLEQKDGIIYLTLNRPDAYNSLHVPMLEELLENLKQVTEMNEHIVVLKGSGKGFSAGGDIKSMLGTFDTPFESIMQVIGDVVTTLYAMNKLTICAIHGAAAGLGLSIGLGCDHVIADKHAKIAMNFIGIGLVPDGGGHFFLKNRLGDMKAKSIIWEGKTFTAAEAFQIGLIDDISENLEEAVSQKTAEWLEKPVLSMLATKNIFVQQSIEALKDTLKLETFHQAEMRKTLDHQEGIKAFIEKRRPVFTGN